MRARLAPATRTCDRIGDRAEYLLGKPDRVAAIKATWDNMFHHNANIRPAAPEAVPE